MKNQVIFAVASLVFFGLCLVAPGGEPGRIGWTQTDQSFESNPRYLEEHPELRRISESAQISEARAMRNELQLAKLTENRALANSPRFLEEYPQLQRPVVSIKESQARANRINSQIARLLQNQAWAGSPRAREDFPGVFRLSASRLPYTLDKQLCSIYTATDSVR